MARDISKRLKELQRRRKGTDRLNRLSENEIVQILIDSVDEETWEKKVKTNQPYTRYALGAMQEVGANYTRISVETAERVGQQLNDRLKALGFNVEFRLQGSVPLNVHIRGVSDVDLLTLNTDFLIIATFGAKNVSGQYGSLSATSQTSLGTLTELRSKCESVLKNAYPAATVDTSGGKAISLYGGSLARPVDVVPSHWFDTIDYQSSNDEADRAVVILDKKVPETKRNWPFLHIRKVNVRDLQTSGGLKKAIRLCKNVKNDSVEDGKTINLSSFDIASTMYHADITVLRASSINELAVLSETQRHLDWLTTNESEAKKLMTPDGSRLIFDNADKLAGLRSLSIEMDDLLKEVAKEQRSFGTTEPTLSESRMTVASVLI